MMYTLTKFPHLALTRIDLHPNGLRGFEHFLTSFLYRDDKLTFLVDIGPASTAPDLLLALHDLGVNRLDFILLTHIHLDHAGAAGHLARAFPQTPLVCHPKGLKHLHQPQKLWEASLAVLRENAVAYHEPLPAPAEQLLSCAEFHHPDIKVIEAPGHAPHHMCFAHSQCLFIGEAAGIFFNLGAGYLRPATPPRFAMDLALQTLDKLELIQPNWTAFAHYGVSDSGLIQIRQMRDQLHLWADTAQRVIIDGGGTMQDCTGELLLNDPLVANFSMFNDDEKARELDFFENALLGLLGWLGEQSSEKG